MLERRSTVYVACAASFAIGLFFIFVWTPLPWGWQGIDDYYRIALSLANGESFPTVHLVWGYAYFLAFFYRLFGDHPWIPLVAQAALNACIPLLLYHLVRRDLGERAAVTSALLAGVFSFNTVYASTQSADSVCTVLVVATMLCLAIGGERRPTSWFVAAGLLVGVAYQFRPNLILFPAFIAAVYLTRTGLASFNRVVAFLLAFVIAAAPWVIRNYRWTGRFIPASTHGGVQLWFGTLQIREYQDSWLYNPRAAFEFPPVDYTSIDEQPIVITATAAACRPASRDIALVYWTNRDRAPQRVGVKPDDNGRIAVAVPPQPPPTAVYYYFDGTPDAPDDPRMVVVSRDHLGDLDVDGHALDVFDVARMLRHVAWHESLENDTHVDFDGDGRVTDSDIRQAAWLIIDNPGADPIALIGISDDAATLRFRDGSELLVPRSWSGRITDLRLETPVVNSFASQIVNRSRSFAGLHARRARASGVDACLALENVGANRTPNRRLPHEMYRFTALALDNIRADRWGFARASAWRALRVFVVAGSGDRRTAYQFSGAPAVYAVGRTLSIAYVALFVAGVIIAWRRGLPVAMLLAPIVYVPVTICFMLINARYSMTTQPFVFAFVAMALSSVGHPVRGASGERHR